MLFKGSGNRVTMKHILSFFIFIMLFSSTLLPIYSENLFMYKVNEQYIIKDISYDKNLDSFYLVGEIKGSNNSFIIKLRNGEFLREQIVENFKVNKILTDKYSNSYILGKYQDGNASVIKVTSSLGKRWETKIKYSDMDIISSYIVNDNQEITVIGYSNYKRESDTFIVKIDRNGKIISEKILDIGPYERPYEVIEDSYGNFYLTGEAKNKNYDMFFCKLSNDFDILWIDYFDNENWEDGGLGLELIEEELVATGYSGKAGWYVFDTVFLRYSPEGNVSKFVRKSYSGGSDWIKQFRRNGEYYYAVLWDILTNQEHTLKLDDNFNLLKKDEIEKDEIPIKILNINDKTYFIYVKENIVYLRDLE